MAAERSSSGAPRAGGAPWGWEAAQRRLDVAIVGATGAVGRELATLLLQAAHPREKLACYARSGRTLDLGAEGRLEIRPLEIRDSGPTLRADLAFLCTPSAVSRELAPRLAERGVQVVDLSSALRMDPEIPLVIPEINGELLDGDGGPSARGPRIVANPNCTTAVAAVPLAALDARARLLEAIVVSYQAASGAGQGGLETLVLETREAAGAGERGRSQPSAKSPFPAVLALNVIPGVAEPDETGVTGEERKIEQELRKILARPDLVVEATTARVPVERCHSVAVHARFERALSPADAREILAAAPGVVLVDDPHGPRPRECAGTDPVHVGRIRAGARGPGSLCFFAVGDQLRKGAALNALQVAARLRARG